VFASQTSLLFAGSSLQRLLGETAMAQPNFQFIKPRRPVSRVFVHCSASDNPAHDNIATMTAWHKARGFATIGYHYFINKAGAILIGRSLESDPAAQQGHNKGTIAICLHGLAADKFTPAQFAALRLLTAQIDDAYGLGRVTFHGHREVAAKECPVFDYKRVLSLDRFGRLGRLGTVSAPALAVNDNKPRWTSPKAA
jgi:N-acetylmuramoyl-L-alanine amidase